MTEIVEIFKAISKLLTSLQTFVEYSFERNRLNLTDQEYEDYKSKYFMLYHRAKNSIQKVSVLDDVDFCIELIESDRINVAYIMNLIRNIDVNDIKKREKQIDYIREQLQRSSNTDLYRKIDLLQAFLDVLAKGLTNQTVEEAYEAFEEEQRQKDIEAFIAANGVEKALLTGLLSEYEFSGTLDEGEIRDSITAPMGLLKKKALVRNIVDFIKMFTEKYQ